MISDSSLMPIDSVSQNLFNVPTRGSWSSSNKLSLVPDIMRFVTLVSELVADSVGPDNSHPNLLLIAVGPTSPRTISVVTKSQ